MDATFGAFCEIQLAKIRQAHWTYQQKAYVPPVAPAVRQPRAAYHGTINGYAGHHCRCDACLRVGRAYHRELRQEKKYQRSPYGVRGAYQRRLFDVVEAYS